jgi:hypothetical protein
MSTSTLKAERPQCTWSHLYRPHHGALLASLSLLAGQTEVLFSLLRRKFLSTVLGQPSVKANPFKKGLFYLFQIPFSHLNVNVLTSYLKVVESVFCPPWS